MDRKRMSRRDLLRLTGVGAAGLVLAACGPTPTPAAEPTKAEEAATAAPEATSTPLPAVEVPPTNTPVPPRLFGQGKMEIVVWYQDWEGATKVMTALTPGFIETHPDATVNLQAIGYGDLMAKTLPAIAAGTEGDVLMGYTNWVVGTDVSQVYLDLTDAVGGAKTLGEQMWESALSVTDMPEGKVFYFPWTAGIRGACLTVNQDHMKEQDIDYLNFQSWEEVIEAGKAVTQKNADGKITRAGFSPTSSNGVFLFSLIWQLGGKFYDKESGKWSLNSPEGEEAAQMLYDIYWKHQTCDWELFTSEFQAVSQKLVSIWGDGAWTAGFQIDSAGVPADNIVCPVLQNATEKVLYPDHIGIWALSRQLKNNQDKMKVALDYAFLMVSPEALFSVFDIYSGVCMTKAVYESPEIEKVKYGPMSKRVATGMWPIARYPQDHVANYGPAYTELSLAMRKETSIKEALAAMDTYMQSQEDEARERIGI